MVFNPLLNLIPIILSNELGECVIKINSQYNSHNDKVRQKLVEIPKGIPRVSFGTNPTPEEVAPRLILSGKIQNSISASITQAVCLCLLFTAPLLGRESIPTYSMGLGGEKHVEHRRILTNRSLSLHFLRCQEKSFAGGVLT